MKREREKEEENLSEEDYGMKGVTDGAKALSLNDADVKGMAEKKTEAPESDELKMVETKLKELRQAYEDTLEEYRSNPRKGLYDKKESLFRIAERLALIENDCHFLQDSSHREKAGQATAVLFGEVRGALRDMEDALQRVSDVRPVIDWTRLNLWMKNPNLG